jgi:hypothetical protein
MKKIAALSLALVVGFIFWGFGQEKIEDIAKNAPPRGKYPDASAVVVRAAQTFTLDSNGTKTEEYFRALEIFTLTGREKFSDFRIPFDKNNETVAVLLAKTIRGDGTAIDVEQKAINDVTPPELAEADLYANILHRVLSFSAVDPGSVLAIQYQKKNEKAGNVEGVVLFQSDEPMVSKELKITLPKDRLLKYKIKGLSAELKEEISEDQQSYHLLATDSPQIKPEEYMPPLEELASKVVFSTFADWKDASREFSDSFYKAANPSPEIRAFTDTLIRGAAGEPEKIRKIFFFVVREIRSVRFAFGEGGFDVHDAAVVLKNRYGDWKDKSGLLVAMLKAAGVAAYPVLVQSRAVPPEEDVPTVKQFDALLVAVPRGEGGLLFLNPFADSNLFGFFQEGRGSRGLLVKPDSAEFVDVRCLAEAESVLKSEITAAIGKDGAIGGKISSEFSGVFDKQAREKLKDMTAKERNVFYTELVNKLCEDGKAIKSELSDPKDLAQKVRLALEFGGQNYGIFQGPIMLVPVLEAPYIFSDMLAIPSLAKRKYPFRLAGESRVYSTVTLKIPAGFKPLYLPTAFSFQKDYGDFSFSAVYDPARSSVVVKKALVFKKRDIPIDQYEEFKKIMDSYGITKNNLILLEKK